MKLRKYSESSIRKLKDLRKSGYTIGEIMEALKMPKTTVWHHVQGVDLNEKALGRIRSRRGGSMQRRVGREKQALEKALKILSSKQQAQVVALAMLYWAEGSKREFSFINTDVRMMRLFLRLMKKVFDVSADQFRFTVRLYGNASVEESLEYWSRELAVSKEKFKVRINDGQKKSRSKYGMCRISMKKGGNMLKIFTALIELVSTKPL